MQVYILILGLWTSSVEVPVGYYETLEQCEAAMMSVEVNIRSEEHTELFCVPEEFELGWMASFIRGKAYRGG